MKSPYLSGMTIFRKKTLIIFFATVLLVGAGAYVLRQSETHVDVVHPLQGPVVQAVYATGTVEPTVMLPIAPRQGGRLVEIMVDEGMAVKKGQLLARMEDTDIQKTIEQLQSQYELAQNEYNRKMTLGKSGAISKQAMDQAHATLDTARGALDKAKAEQDYTKLFAAEDGRIIRRDGEVGEFISTGQAVFWMECCAPLRVTVEVDEEDIPLVKVGQDVLIHADAFPEAVYDGIVQSITPKGDAISRSYRVRVGLKGETPLLTGMTAESNIIIQKKDMALLLPVSAVVDKVVWVVEGGRLHKKSVTTGIKTPDNIEVLSGVSGEDDVVKMPLETMKEGQTVNSVLETKRP